MRACEDTMHVKLIGHFKPRITDIYLHIWCVHGRLYPHAPVISREHTHANARKNYVGKYGIICAWIEMHAAAADGGDDDEVKWDHPEG